jgi:multiple sugar transport system permease protein
MSIATRESIVTRKSTTVATRWPRIDVGLTARYVALTALAIIYAMPFIWMVSLSLKPDTDLNQIPPSLLPSHLTFVNYPHALLQPMLYFPRFFLNTFEYVGLSVVGEIIVSSVVAYGFARIPFKGSNFLFAIVLSTMMLPNQVTLIPQYLLFKQFGWLDSLKPLIIPSWFGVAFYIFLLRQFFMTLPRELDDAAYIDGASHLDILFRILLPLSIPALITCVALSVVARWNDFFGPLIYVNSINKTVLAVALTFFNIPAQPSPQNLLMAASVVTALPVILLFLFLQDYFVQGVTMTGLKEG